DRGACAGVQVEVRVQRSEVREEKIRGVDEDAHPARAAFSDLRPLTSDLFFRNCRRVPMMRADGSMGLADVIAYKRSRFSTRLPTDRLYTPSHFWCAAEPEGVWRVGFTKFATRMLGDLVEFGF